MRNKKPVSVKQKNSTKAKRLIICCLSFSLLLSGCACSNPYIKDVYIHPKFKTDYTIEEHIKRISAKTERNFAEELANSELVSYNVEIVYAYDGDPEYFLIELEYAEEWESIYMESGVTPISYSTKYRHLIGYIRSDKYFRIGDFREGRSSYRYYGYTDNKKYYNGDGIEAVEKEGQIIKLFDRVRCCSWYGDGISPEFHIHKDEENPCCIGEVIPEKYYQGMSESRLVLNGEL